MKKYKGLVNFLRDYQKSCEIMHVRKMDAKNYVEQLKDCEGINREKDLQKLADLAQELGYDN